MNANLAMIHYTSKKKIPSVSYMNTSTPRPLFDCFQLTDFTTLGSNLQASATQTNPKYVSHHWILGKSIFAMISHKWRISSLYLPLAIKTVLIYTGLFCKCGEKWRMWNWINHVKYLQSKYPPSKLEEMATRFPILHSQLIQSFH